MSSCMWFFSARLSSNVNERLQAMKLTRIRTCVLAVFLIGDGVVQSIAQSGNLGDIESKLYATFKITQTTADRSDIVTPGSILELHKGGLQMAETTSNFAPTFQFKDGRLQMTTGSMLMVDRDIPKRTFVPGEKVWITGIKVQQDAVILTVYSDPYGDSRFYGALKFPFPVKKVIPPTDDVMKMIAEVVTAVPMDNAPAAPSASVAPPAPIAPIAPPPPPPDQPPAPPKTISAGQTKDQVLAMMGQPSKDIKLSAKEILVYPDMKIILVGGKVSDVQ